MMRVFLFVLAAAALAALVLFASLRLAERDRLPSGLIPLVEPIGPIGLDAIDPVADATYVGSPNCAECHQDEYNLWLNSHHDLAMKVATDETVLGDFNNTEFVYTPTEGLKPGQTVREVTRFYRDGLNFMVRTRVGKGENDFKEFRVLYTFGWEPLQQYLVDTGDGKLQCLPFAWDSREVGVYKDMDDEGNVVEVEGGQRWFHLYGDEYIPPGDLLHWTGVNQRWNFMCAECHSTNLKKNYDLANERYNTTWAEINVACESCHGPGSDHIKWGRANKDIAKKDAPPAQEMGLVVSLKNDGGGVWQYNQSKNVYERTAPLTSRVQMETCGRCHARRYVINDQYKHGKSFHDAHVLITAEDETLYFSDGQIKDEVYVYGSFVQSKMFHQGVRCVDCHDPHSLLLKQPGNALCVSCHDKSTYDSTKHHFHKMDQAGADCVSCHMYERPYMGNDWRSDHSFRIPRPDLSVALGTPNTCTQCHMQMDTNAGRDRQATDKWAHEWVGKWYGPREEKDERLPYAYAFKANSIGRADAPRRLNAVVMDKEYPAYMRASALRAMINANTLTPEARVAALTDKDPILRTVGVSSLDLIAGGSEQEDKAAQQQRWELAHRYGLLTDDVRSVRIEAVRVLAGGFNDVTDPLLKEQFNRALDEFIAAQTANSDRGSSHMNLGVLYLNLDDKEKAVAAYKRAIDVEPDFVPAHINLADHYRDEGDKVASISVLRKALTIQNINKVPVLHYALGMALTRMGDPDNRRLALESFERAARYGPDDPTNAYAHALALHGFGRINSAIGALEKARQQHPENLDILFALATFSYEAGQMDKAAFYTRILKQLAPNNPQVRALDARMLNTGAQ